jgi:uncharacterized circularly permuted ATP-grasp superfamily protein
VGDLLDDYPTVAGYDEMFGAGPAPRDQYRALHAALQTLSRVDFDERCSARDRAFRDQGITFQLSGEERPFPLDLVPRILPAAEWALVERGVAQRVRALELFLADVYGPGRILEDRVIPRRLVVSSPQFERAASGIVPHRGVHIHVAGIDLVRDAEGRFRVLEDNVRTPSGISYVVENRRAMTRVFPELFASHRVRRVSDYPTRLLESLRATAPPSVTDPCVVVLTPGVHNSAYFEHSFLARQMGVELVEGGDLICHDDVVSMRTTEGLQRVDVIYRRIDDEFLDPLHFRPESVVGCPGIVNAARAGAVTIANGLGNGVADDKAIYPYVPQMIRYYLEEDPILANVETFHLEDADVCAWALERLDSLVVKPVDGSGGYGLVIGPHADDATLTALAVRIRANPRGWIAQEPVELSTAPTYVDGSMRPRHLDLRPFAVNDGERVWVVPGGLTRVALPEGSLVVNSSQGGGSKDTWVLASREHPDGPAPEAPAADDPEPGPVAEAPLRAPALGPLATGQQQQQQQQQMRDAPC